MAKLKKVLKFKVGDGDARGKAFNELEAFLASGVAQGEVEVSLVFDAPSLSYVRRTREEMDEESEPEAETSGDAKPERAPRRRESSGVPTA